MSTTRAGRRDRGGALILAVLMIFLTTAFAAFYIGITHAELTKVSSGVARERAMAIADAAVRDAIVWRTSPTGAAVKLSNPGPPATSTPFTKPWTSWGSGGQYQWTMSDVGNNYLKILAEGRFSTAQGDAANNTTARYLEVDVEVYITTAPATGIVPAAGMLLDPTNAGVAIGATPYNQLYTGAGAPQPKLPAVDGADKAGGPTVGGFAFQNTAMTYTTGSAAVTGNPPITTVTPATATTLQNLITQARAQAANPPLFQKYSMTTGTPVSAQPGYATSPSSPYLIYIYLGPTGSSPGPGIMGGLTGTPPGTGTHVLDSGPSDSKAVYIFDIAPGVMIQEPLIQRGTGNWIRGAVIVNQQGVLQGNNNGADNGFQFIDNQNANSNFLQYDSVAVGTALSQLNPTGGFKIVSYRVLPTVAH